MNELIALAAALVIHELGHLLAAKILGIPLVRFRLNPMGGVMTFDFSRSAYEREAAVHFSGPAAGLISGVIGWRILQDPFFTGISVVLACVNLLPIRGLDGGGILRCVLSQNLPAHPGLLGLGFGFGHRFAADSAFPQKLVGGGNIECGGSEAADFQQNALLIGGVDII